MKKVKVCEEDNCIPTLSSCVAWNGGTVEFLGICDGDSLNNIVLEIVTKLEEIVGDDLSQFDIDSLLAICNQQAPAEVTIISILTLLKNNQVCLKDFIDTLSEQLADLFDNTGVVVNLKCYADFDNLGNPLSITRNQLDQLIIDNLCSQRLRIETLEGKVINLQSQIDNISITTTVDELSFAITCSGEPSLSLPIAPTSSQVIAVAGQLCQLETQTGIPSDIQSALASTPSDFTTIDFTSLPGWIITPDNWAENYNNLLLAFKFLLDRVIFMEKNCCAASCKDIELGFTAIFNEDNDGVLIKFTSGAGTDIPTGFTDGGSTIIITDKDGNIAQGVIDIVANFNNNLEYEISVAGLNLTGDLEVDITAILTNGVITCEKCIHKLVKSTNCGYCTITATGADGSSATIVYDDGSGGVPIVVVTPPTTTTTTTSSTTTTTTVP